MSSDGWQGVAARVVRLALSSARSGPRRRSGAMPHLPPGTVPTVAQVPPGTVPTVAPGTVPTEPMEPMEPTGLTQPTEPTQQWRSRRSSRRARRRAAPRRGTVGGADILGPTHASSPASGSVRVDAVHDRPAGAPDFRGVSTVRYEPEVDGTPDPGEVVWTWVAYEDDPRRGKDRPVLVVGRDDSFLLALMLSSRDHEGPGSDQADEEAHGRHWLDLGAGAWDARGRPSQVRVDRVLRVDPSGVRREGATLDRERFELVAQRLRADHGWS